MNRQLPSSYVVTSFETLMHLTFFSCDAEIGEKFILKAAKPLYANYGVDLDRVVSALIKHTVEVNSDGGGGGYSGGMSNPYHNYAHCLRVGFTAFHIALSEFQNELNLPNDLRLLLLAGLFHDANHTGGKLYKYGTQFDSVNIERAFAALDAVNAELCLMPDDDVARVKQLISATEFPSPAPKNFLALCLRDADLLSMMWPDRDFILATLCQEQQTLIGFDENLDFLQNIGYSTKSGRRILEFIKTKPWIINQMTQQEYDANVAAADEDDEDSGEADDERFALPA